MAWPTSKIVEQAGALPGDPPAVLALIEWVATLPGASTPKPSCDSWPMASIDGMPVAPPCGNLCQQHGMQDRQHRQHRLNIEQP